MKHLGLICVFSSHNIGVLWMGGILTGWAMGLGPFPHQFSQFKANFFSQADGWFSFLNKMLLFIQNFNFLFNFNGKFSSEPLNVWVVNCPIWTGLIELDHIDRPLSFSGIYRVILKWMLWSSRFIVRAERIMRLYLSINTDQWNIVHNNSIHWPMRQLEHTFFILAFWYYYCFPLSASKLLHPSPPLSCPEKTCANGCIQDRETWTSEMMYDFTNALWPLFEHYTGLQLEQCWKVLSDCLECL